MIAALGTANAKTFTVEDSNYSINSVGSSVSLTGLLDNTTEMISATPYPTEGGSITGAGSYSTGTTCTLTATPNAGYYFVNWTEADTIYSTDATIEVQASSNRTFTANFAVIPTLTIASNNSQWGSVTLEGVQSIITDPVATKTFEYCYSCDGFNTDYPQKGISWTPVIYNSSNDNPQGPWKVEYVGNYSYPDNTYDYDPDGIYSLKELVYHLDDSQPIPIFMLYQWDANTNDYQSTVYGVVCAYVNNNTSGHAAFFEDGEGRFYFLSDAAAQSGNVPITFTEDLTDGVPTIMGIPTVTLPDGVQPTSTENVFRVLPGTEVTVKATPAEHYYMQKWNDEAALNSNVAVSTTFTVTKDTTLTAHFVHKPILTLTSNPSTRGTVELDGAPNQLPAGVVQGNNANEYIVDYDTTVKVIATPIDHYHLASWNNIGGNNLTQYVTMTWDSLITGAFAIDTFTLTLKTNDQAMGAVEVTNHLGNPAIVSHGTDATGTSTYKVNYGAEVIIKATANTGYHVGSWSNGATVTDLAESTQTITVTSDSTITANFATSQYTVTAAIANGQDAMGSVSGTATVDYLSNVTLEATAHNGHHFVNWTEADTIYSTDATIEVQALGDRTFTAKFAITPAELAWSPDDFTGYTFIDFNNYRPTLNNPHNVSVRYGLVENVSSIIVNPETGIITNSFNVPSIYTQGTYHVYAVHETDQTYYYDSVVYTLHVNWAALVSLLRNIEEGGNITFVNAVGDLTHAYSGMTAYLAPNASFSVSAAANDGYHFSKWQIGNNIDGYTDHASTNTITYAAPAEITSMSSIGLKAVFDTNTYALNVLSDNAEMGSVSGSNPAAKHFLNYEISATPTFGHIFRQWSDGNTNNPRTVSLTSDSTFTAYFSAYSCDPVTDVDGNTYSTVGIGNKCWMAENLRTLHYHDGREIANIYEYQCSMHPNAEENVSIYGRLYDWYDAADASRPTRGTRIQGICPEGWFLPNEEDFEDLSYVDLNALRSDNYWLYNNGNNSTGFDWRPAGTFNINTMRYENLHGNAYLWSSVATSSTEAYCHMADCNCYLIYDIITNKENAFSVRCVHD